MEIMCVQILIAGNVVSEKNVFSSRWQLRSMKASCIVEFVGWK